MHNILLKLSYARLALFSFVILLSAAYLGSAFAAHSMSADPAGGIYNSSQSVTLVATQNSTIYFTTDGSDPTNASSVYASPIEISSNTTLKFFAVAAADNHTSNVVTEIYTIDSTDPSVSASPPGGEYNTPQSVTLEADEPATIYYTTDGIEPSNASSLFVTPIDITVSSVLKFFAEDLAGNASPIITENYTIFPIVITTYPEDGQTGVPASTVINATFSEPMDESTINSTTFILEDRDHIQFTGSVTYDPSSNTATFIPDFLSDSVLYTATLKKDIKDLAGNSLQEDYLWTFSTGPDLLVLLFEIKPGEFNLLGGGTFTITPNPFTLSGSLTVEDNDPSIDEDPNDGFIFISNIKFGTYVISETGVPTGFGNIYDRVTVTAHETNTLPFAEFRNRNLTIPITDFPPTDVTGVVPPFLTSEQFDLYKDTVQVGIFLGFQGPAGFSDPKTVIAVGPNQIPGARLETLTTLEPPEVTLESVLFNIDAAPGSTAEELFTSFRIPTYPDIDGTIVSDTFYFVPAFVIPYGDTGNNYLLTPVVGHTQPEMTLVVEQPSYVASQEAKVERVNMTFNTAGNDIGFSFAITDERPPGTPDPQLDAPALYLDIDFVGDVDFSDPAAFKSSPVIDILVNKTLPGFPQLPDGCADFQLLMFNEGTGEWEVISQLRSPTKDTDTQCGFTLQPEHFSKFAVGGVKGQTISTENESRRSGGGGGGSRSTGVTSLTSGNDIETTATTQAGSVRLEFQLVETGGGQLRVDTNQLSAFEDIFYDFAIMAQDNDEHGIVHLDGVTYTTAGHIFDIDASQVNYQGEVTVTIPYDERAVILLSGSESNVRFLHYDEETGVWEDATASVDELANTVTGVLDSLSPVTAAVIIGQGITFDEEYFEENPLARMEIGTPSFAVSEQTGEVTISTTVKNMQRMDQEYVAVVQIVDANNIAYYIDWATGSAASAQDSAASINWKPMEKGSYSIMIFICTDLDNPILLSTKVLADIDI